MTALTMATVALACFSVRNRHSSTYLNALGFRSRGTNLNIRYQNNTLLMDALMGIKYNIAENNPMKFGFERQAAAGNISFIVTKMLCR